MLLLHCITQNLHTHTHTESDLATISPENETVDAEDRPEAVQEEEETVDAEDRPEAVQEEEEMWMLRAGLKQFKRKKDQQLLQTNIL